MAAIITSSPAAALFSNTTILTKADVTAATAWTVVNSPVTLFTVTGVVRAIVLPVVTTLFTSTANTGTLALGITGNTGMFRAATTADGSTKLLANAPWIDANALANRGAAVPTADGPGYILNGANIILTVATNPMTAGGMTLYCLWTPLSPGATVV